MKRSSRGIPANLKPLAKRGERVRYNGFWLNDSEEDRAIATWLDETKDAGALIKHLIYGYLTGATPAPVSTTTSRESGLGEAASILGDLDV